MRMTERLLSPPWDDLHPQYRRYRTPSEVELTCIEGEPVIHRQTGVEYDWRGQEEFIPINPSVQSRPQMEEMVTVAVFPTATWRTYGRTYSCVQLATTPHSSSPCPPDCCTQNDLTFLDNPISSTHPPQSHVSRRETRPAAGRRSVPITTSNILTLSLSLLSSTKCESKSTQA